MFVIDLEVVPERSLIFSISVFFLCFQWLALEHLKAMQRKVLSQTQRRYLMILVGIIKMYWKMSLKLLLIVII